MTERVSHTARSSKDQPGRRSDVLRLLQEAPAAVGVGAIADQLGVHPNTVRFHLDVLVADGWVEQVRPDRRRPGRPPLLFRAVRQMDPGGMRHYRLLAEILLNRLAAERGPTAKALAAGRAWGRRLNSSAENGSANGTGSANGAGIGAEEAVTRLVELLDELGFDPERRGQAQVGLRHCPFLELAETRTDVICPIHLGIMQGALETWGAPITVEQLDAFAEPDLCVAQIASRGVTT